MARLLVERNLMVASHNKGKIKEITELLKEFAITVISPDPLELPDTIETGVTFTENAILKALKIAEKKDLPALADDSGLVVNALGGAPGLYSARWAKEEKNFSDAMLKIHTLLGDTKDRSAHFICALALAWPDGHTETFEGIVKGRIVWPPRGIKGFGYDSIFQPLGFTSTFAEMESTVKQTMSHRARAFDRLAISCLKA